MISKSIKEATLTDGTKIKLSLEVQSNVDYQDFTRLKTALDELHKIYNDVVESIFCDDCTEAVKKVIGV